MDSPIMCKCDETARKVTVKKEGKNQGREFWQCKGREKRCGLLLWEDEMEKSKSKKENNGKSAPEKESGGADSPILCKCGNLARRVTVKKEGKNQGREFWQCKGIEKRCGLLLWIDEMEKSTTKKESAPEKESAPKKESESADSNPLCKCEKETRRLTVKKEGKNQGREFYQCKGTDKKCGFFKWIEAEKSPSKRAKESDSESDEGDRKRSKKE